MERILLAFDGSPAAWYGLDLAAHLASVTGATVGVVHVTPLGSSGDLTDEARAAREALLGRGIDAAAFTAAGNPADEISRLALACDFDTIVLGSSPRGLLRRLVDGSTSLRLGAGASVSVIIARPT